MWDAAHPCSSSRKWLAGLIEPWVPACSSARFCSCPLRPPSPHSQSELPTALIRHRALCLPLADWGPTHRRKSKVLTRRLFPTPVTSPSSAIPTFQHVPATLACFVLETCLVGYRLRASALPFLQVRRLSPVSTGQTPPHPGHPTCHLRGLPSPLAKAPLSQHCLPCDPLGLPQGTSQNPQASPAEKPDPCRQGRAAPSPQPRTWQTTGPGRGLAVR